jgi:hypothetical protein
MIAYHHAVFTLSRLERYIPVDNIVEHQLRRTLEGIPIAATAR